MKFRILGLTIHRSIGILLGLVFLVMGFTGSTLVFYQEINSWLNPQLMRVVPQDHRLSLEVVLNIIHSRFSGMELHSIVLPRNSEEVYKLALKSHSDEWIDIFVNPYTGDVLGSQEWGHTLMSFIYNIHIYMMMGEEVGYKFVGFCGLLLLVLVVSGLVVWPGWRNLSRGLWMRWKAPVPLLTYDFHKVGGFVTAVFLILIATTGTAMVFKSEFESAAYWLTHTPKPTQPVSTLVTGQTPLALTQILHTAETSLPEGVTTLIFLPHEADGVFEVQKKLPGDMDFYGNSKIYIDQYTGKVLRVDNALKAPFAAKINNALLSLHSGFYGGLGMRWLYVFIGLAPPALLISGILMWRNRVNYYRTQKPRD